MLKGKSKLEPITARESSGIPSRSNGFMWVEILDTVDISSFSPEIRNHYSTHVLPMLKRLIPDGPAIHFAFLADPPSIEIRKMVT